MRYICTNCGYLYNPQTGDPEHGIVPGTEFKHLPEHWQCPVCYVGKEKFDLFD